ncbi:alkene reductase [Sphingobium nicotianae]|uniref:Alkene reductase n=1 Tax=Sphingobium nicotianae TaxID=2782607 RepID=A0A9X1DFF9_9SPHN|nr:alkene reductase [Sphingobium nicotianae]MBT2188523.1 alkene reductase [Sphingobium nicotianae]
MTSLFDPITIGGVTLSNRIMMAPMTRGRATREHVPLPRMADYYAQRAGAGLIISEAAPISVQGAGWPYSPGLWTDEQVEAWKPVTQAVHDAGGRIVAQLWHMGRVVHPAMSGAQPVSASATTAPGEAFTYEGRQPHVEARPLRLDEIPGIIADYVHAAKNAIRAGFDGVQLHGANGYLIDQFLRDSGNHREDAYGGSIENRARLLLEVTQALVDAVGSDKVSVRLSPNGDVQGVIDSNPEPLFVYAARELDRIGIAFLELKEARNDAQQPVSPAVRAVFGGVLVLNGEYGLADGNAAVADGRADAISIGRPFIANPDLVDRLQEGHPLAEVKQGPGLYQPIDEGYADYPRYEVASA